jgi:hypothetical protein
MADQADLVTGQSRSISPPQGTACSRFPVRVDQHMVGIGSMANDVFVVEWRQRSEHIRRGRLVHGFSVLIGSSQSANQILKNLPIPKGLCPKAQGCEKRATLGQRIRRQKPQRGFGFDECAPRVATPLGLLFCTPLTQGSSLLATLIGLCCGIPLGFKEKAFFQKLICGQVHRSSFRRLTLKQFLPR